MTRGARAAPVPPFPCTARFTGDRLVTVGGVDVADLAAAHGTPLYVMDRADLVGRMRAYRAAFGPGVDVVYAAKALCVVGVLQLATAEGLSVDVSSAGELHTARRAGVPAARIVLHGNNKSTADLVSAVDAGVGRVAVDSFSELTRLDAVARERGVVQPVLLRVTPGIVADTHAFVATGHDDVKFGFTLSAGLAHDAAARALALPGLELRGLHCHIGSQISTTAGFGAVAAAMCGLLADIRADSGVSLAELNLGGGLGIAYTRSERALGIDEYAEALLAAVRREAAAAGLTAPRLAVEPGRSIAGPAGLTLYTVGDVKSVPGVRDWVGVDGGMSDNLRPALYGARYEVVAAGPARSGTDGSRRTVALAGRHCETADVVASGVSLPADMRAGDLLAVAATGAYGYAMASNYNRLPRPAMVLVDDGRVVELVRRETLDDVVSHDVVLPRDELGLATG